MGTCTKGGNETVWTPPFIGQGLIGFGGKYMVAGKHL